MEKKLTGKLAIVIPTRNHCEIMEEWIHIFPTQNKISKIKVYVFDSSDNDDTQKLCNNKELITYIRCDANMDIDYKTILCLDNIEEEYVWLCGDGIIPNIDMVNSIVNKYISDGVDILHFFGHNKMNEAYMEKNGFSNEIIYKGKDRKAFFKDFFWSLGCYGISITKKSIINNIDKNEVIRKYVGKNFVYPAIMFEAILKIDEPLCVVLHHNCFTANKMKKTNTWKQDKTAIKIFSKHIVATIQNLPDYYNEYKNTVIKEFCINNQFLTVAGLYRWRSEGLYDIKEFFKYYRYLKQVTGLSFFKLCIIAITPKKSIKT